MNRILIAAALAAVIAPASQAGDKTVYHIGIPKSAFRDLPPGLIGFAGQPFKDLFKAQTGLNGEAAIETDALTIAADMQAGKLQMGVFFGHEFAWAKERYKDLEPIVCSVPRPKKMQAFLLVCYDCKAKNLAEFKGARLALATTSRDHARLFLEKRRAEDMGGVPFSAIAKTATVHAAIEKVLEGEADVTVADSAAWSYYQKLYPGRSQNIRVLAESEVFPPTVLAFRKGTIDAAKLKAIREGLLNAHENSKAVRIMNMIHIERFDPIPANYDISLKACLKAYPTPLADK